MALKFLLAIASVHGAFAYAANLPKSTWGAYRCPIDNGTLPSPTYGSDAIFTTCTQRVINAPVDKVYAAIINFSNYHLWNQFVRNVVGINGSVSPASLYVEMKFSNHALIGNSTPFPTDEIVTYLQHQKDCAFAAWKFNDQVGGLFQDAEHPNVLTSTNNGQTLYVSWESYYGLSALPTDLLLATRLREQFALQGDNLKAYVEHMG